MEFALEKIMAISQEGIVKEYCNWFQILFDQVKNLEEMSEFYAIYIFICGLEPGIRKIFAKWHQYSCTKSLPVSRSTSYNLVFLPDDGFGAAMALVKTDVGDNITVSTLPFPSF
uniref:Retrotransposon gag domain-containing protein n=1 Tax=Helianthus annuus TaxID=4232 RepID=A0A251RRK1_HELAN